MHTRRDYAIDPIFPILTDRPRESRSTKIKTSRPSKGHHKNRTAVHSSLDSKHIDIWELTKPTPITPLRFIKKSKTIPSQPGKQQSQYSLWVTDTIPILN